MVHHFTSDILYSLLTDHLCLTHLVAMPIVQSVRYSCNVMETKLRLSIMAVATSVIGSVDVNISVAF